MWHFFLPFDEYFIKFWYPHLQRFQRSSDNCGKIHVRIILGHLIDAFRSNPNRYWTFLKCFTKKGALHPVSKDGNSLITDDVDRVSLLNHVFASKFSDPGVASYPPVTQHPWFTLTL